MKSVKQSLPNIPAVRWGEMQKRKNQPPKSGLVQSPHARMQLQTRSPLGADSAHAVAKSEQR